MNQDYVNGFVEKCAELGVNPEELVKQGARGAIANRRLFDIAQTLLGPRSTANSSVNLLDAVGEPLTNISPMRLGRIMEHLPNVLARDPGARSSWSSKGRGAGRAYADLIKLLKASRLTKSIEHM